MKRNLIYWNVGAALALLTVIAVKLLVRGERKEAPRDSGTVAAAGAAKRREIGKTVGVLSNSTENLLLNTAGQLSNITRRGESVALRHTRVPPDEAVRIGDELHQRRAELEIFRRDHIHADLVSRVVAQLELHRIESSPSLKVHLVQSSKISVYGAPNGYIYITTGFVERFPKEHFVAMALAHELGHVDLDHIQRRLSAVYASRLALRNLGEHEIDALVLQLRAPYPPDEVFQADAYGFDLARRAGWNADQILALFVEMERDAERMKKAAGPESNRTKPKLESGLEATLDSQPSPRERRLRLEQIH
jgi:predicted Zn-dependent protease